MKMPLRVLAIMATSGAALVAGPGCSLMEPNRSQEGRMLGSAGEIYSAAGSLGRVPELSLLGMGFKLLGHVADRQQRQHQNGVGEAVENRGGHKAHPHAVRYVANPIRERVLEEQLSRAVALEQEAKREGFSLDSLGDEYGFLCSRWDDGANGCPKDGEVDISGREFINLGRPFYEEDEPITVVMKFRNKQNSVATFGVIKEGPDDFYVKNVLITYITRINDFCIYTFPPGSLAPGRYTTWWNVRMPRGKRPEKYVKVLTKNSDNAYLRIKDASGQYIFQSPYKQIFIVRSKAVQGR